jgi:hypothetical protein
MDLKKVEVRNLIGPQKIIHNGDVYRIIKYPRKYLIKGYKLTLIDGKLDNVHINGEHPNAQPSTGKFCIPNELRKMPFDHNTKQLLETILSHFNLNNCYFTPWNEIQYRKQEV